MYLFNALGYTQYTKQVTLTLDYNTLLKLLPPNSPQVGPTKRALVELKPRIEEAQKKETGEVLEKLKGIGNSILGVSIFFSKSIL